MTGCFFAKKYVMDLNGKPFILVIPSLISFPILFLDLTECKNLDLSISKQRRLTLQARSRKQSSSTTTKKHLRSCLYCFWSNIILDVKIQPERPTCQVGVVKHACYLRGQKQEPRIGKPALSKSECQKKKNRTRSQPSVGPIFFLL